LTTSSALPRYAATSDAHQRVLPVLSAIKLSQGRKLKKQYDSAREYRNYSCRTCYMRRGEDDIACCNYCEVRSPQFRRTLACIVRVRPYDRIKYWRGFGATGGFGGANPPLERERGATPNIRHRSGNIEHPLGNISTLKPKR
jgi:hypothetical protein